MVRVPRSRMSASRSLMPASRRRRIRSADSWIGVSGFLISCARRRATSPQAASRCACKQRGDVIEHDDEADACILTRQRGAGAHERAAPAGAVQVELLAPLLAPGGEAHRERGDELPEALVAGGKFRQRTARGRRQIRAEDRAGGLIGVAHGEGAVDGEHAGREARQDDGEALCARAPPPAWLCVASSRARRRRLVMSLKECTRKPISSREGSGRRVAKSPLPTARVPSIRSCTGRTRRCAE